MKFPQTLYPQVQIHNELLKSRLETVVQVSLIEQYRHLKETGRLANFERVAGSETGTHEGYYFNDSDVYKWLEACAYALKYKPKPELLTAAQSAIDLLEQCQEPSGYLNTFFQLKHPELKWRNTMMMHEMYCLGHLIEAGVAWWEATDGKNRQLFDISLKAANEFASHFGPNLKLGYPGHEELELALFRLSDATEDSKWAEIAGWMIESRGSRPSPFEEEFKDEPGSALSPWATKLLCKDGTYSGEYLQDHLPVKDHTAMVGHAVRAVYLYIAAAEWAIRTHNPSITDALVRIWHNLIERRIYITGGIGPSGDNEGFTTDYDLPNMTAYAESCAACGLFWWASKMVKLTGDSKYTNIMEIALMNNILAGISMDGKKYFYDNPLESRGQHQRTEWFVCACCPPNIARMLLSLDRHIAAVSEEGISINLLIDCSLTVNYKGSQVQIEIESNYPWGNTAKVRVACDPEMPFELKIAFPAGSDSVRYSLPANFETNQDLEGWLTVKGTWSQSTEIAMEIIRPPVWRSSHPNVLDNLGKVALQIGPIVYCVESDGISTDEEEVSFKPITPQHLRIALEEPLELVPDAHLPVVFAYAVALCDVPGEPKIPSEAMHMVTIELGAGGFESLYPPYTDNALPLARVRMIPYFLWNNQGPTHMSVWLRCVDPTDDESIIYN